jgi:hypothetical protein
MVEVNEEVEPELEWSRVGGIGVDLGRGLRLAELWLCLALKAPAAFAAANPRLVCSSSSASSSTQYSWLTSASATSARASSRYFPCRSTLPTSFGARSARGRRAHLGTSAMISRMTSRVVSLSRIGIGRGLVAIMAGQAEHRHVPGLLGFCDGIGEQGVVRAARRRRSGSSALLARNVSRDAGEERHHDRRLGRL